MSEHVQRFNSIYRDYDHDMIYEIDFCPDHDGDEIVIRISDYEFGYPFENPELDQLPDEMQAVVGQWFDLCDVWDKE